MQSQRWAWTHRHAVPMFVASLVALTISVSAAVAFLVFDTGDEENPLGDGGPTPTSGEETPTSNPDETTRTTATTIDECVVDTWLVTAYTEDTSQGDAELVSGEPVFTFAADGTGEADYPSGTEVDVNYLGLVEAIVRVDGPITYQYEASDGTMEFVDQDSSATLESDADITNMGGELTLPEGPLDYTCDGEALAFSGGDGESFELQRAS